MKFLKNPILWLVIIVIGVGYIGYKYVLKTSQLQKELYKKEKRILHKHPYNLYGLARVSSKELWAVGSLGTVLHSTDGGIKWKGRRIGSPEQIFDDISFSDKSNGWIVGNHGCILHSSDRGKTWKEVSVPGVKGYYLTKVFFLDSRHGWIVGDGGTMLKTNDGGKSWQLIDTGRHIIAFNDVVFKDSNTGWVVGEGGLIMKTTDGGLNWQDISPNGLINSLFSICLGEEGELWVSGSGSVILSSIDGGKTWIRKRLVYGDKTLNKDVYRIVEQPYGTRHLGAFAGAITSTKTHNLIYALCRGKLIYSFNSGDSWRPCAMSTKLEDMISKGGWLYDLGYEGVNKAWAVGSWGIILYTDSMEHWDRVN